jgi:translocation and assembly module TamB
LFRAEKIEVGLKIISALKQQVDILSLDVQKPRLYVVVRPDGGTNIPQPKIRPTNDKGLVQELLDLKVQKFVLHDGFAEYNSERMPLDLQAEDLFANVRYEAAGPRYVGDISSKTMHVTGPDIRGAAFKVDTTLALEQSRVQVTRANFVMQKSEVKMNGVVEDLSSPRGNFNVEATIYPSELGRAIQLPVDDRGEMSFRGVATFQTAPFTYKLQGDVAGRGLAYSTKDIKLRDIGLRARLELSPSLIVLRRLDMAALGGHLRGEAELRNGDRFTLNGTAEGLAARQLAALQGQPGGESLSGTVNGPVKVEGLIGKNGVRDLVARATLDITPGTGGIPLSGTLDVNYDQRAGKLALGNSLLLLGSSRIQFSGTLGESLTVHATSTNLNDFLAAFPLIGEKPPKELPVTLKGGTAQFDGTIVGSLKDPRIAGTVDVTRFAIEKRDFDHLTSAFDLTKSGVNLRNLTLDQGPARLTGSGSLGLVSWKPVDASLVAATFTVRNADLGKLVAETGQKEPITGTLTADVVMKGTYGAPQATLDAQATNVTAYEEQFSRVRANITYRGGAVEVVNGDLQAGQAHIKASGAYTHPDNDWKNGDLRFDVSSNNFKLASLHHVQTFEKGLDGTVDLQAQGTARIVKGDFEPGVLTGHAELRNASLDGRPYGNLSLTANTTGSLLDVKANADLRNTKIQGSGQWKLSGDYQGSAHIDIPRLSFATINDLRPGVERKELPFEGFLQGTADITGPLKKPDDLRAEFRLPVVQINANPGARPRAGAQAQDLILKNAQPVVFEATTKVVEIRSAQFTARDTKVEAKGRVTFDSKSPWDLNLDGSINLATLQIFNPDLLASGTSVIRAEITGPLREPIVDGRLELKNASLYLRDVPNGIDQANGLILFDRNRATIQNLTAVTGGGAVKFETGSFVGFGGPSLIYRLQASGTHVRYRSPDGVSLTMDASMNLVGTSQSSVLSGTVTVVRAGFNPHTDVGTLLASTARPVETITTPNEILQGIHLDVRVLSAQSLEVQTSLTRDIQADANLRVRGTLERPSVLGNVTVNSGQAEFFGNKYTINRGEVNFYNPTKIEPVLDMDLETQVRGITVDITFSGTLNKLNFSYRSDPPLESNQIVALLAVGRVPTTVGGLASSQEVNNSSYVATGSNALLGQALSPASGRLQRFFGVSHIKIDPQLTDLTSIPQARLTLEQQISKDITLTYITNLSRTSEQIIRVEWALNKQWSVIALRDENGVFGIDFSYRKRF